MVIGQCVGLTYADSAPCCNPGSRFVRGACGAAVGRDALRVGLGVARRCS